MLFAWPRCGFATTARGLLAERAPDYADIKVEKFSPEHAELALMTGRAHPRNPGIHAHPWQRQL